MLTGILERLGDLSTLGLCLAVALLAFSETAMFLDLFVPGEVGLVIGGAAAATGDHPVGLVIASAAAGAFLGDTTSYLFGLRLGRPLLRRFGRTHPRMAPLVAKSERFFDVHGGRSVFIGRWIGALRAVIPFVAGVSRLRWRSFLLWNFAASLSWAGVVVLIGAYLGPRVASTVDRASNVISVLAIAGIVALWLWHRSGAKRQPVTRRS